MMPRSAVGLACETRRLRKEVKETDAEEES